ncbi:MAG: hypothetical protein Q8N35_13210 [Methylococcaceae bacterium]|nr:hypothetical protein [Methylococcaceae bacterium]MDP2395037.1 hypothetical protein [Methylococcaceae bacterium]MDP3020537.1 hypothetical protein [Methylococcaceae bacterium]MDP3389728.1 hypothetical protein [Methylococcaceae bacterium]MDP3932525.1 hypothetical protein [Methylococcaceae bacterium]
MTTNENNTAPTLEELENSMKTNLGNRRDMVVQAISSMAAEARLPKGSPALALIQLVNHTAIYYDEIPEQILKGYVLAAALLFKDLVEAKQITDGIIKEQNNG